MPQVRITAFPAYWLALPNSFSDSTRIEWSTGETIQPGDIQVFAVSTTIGDHPELANDSRRDLEDDPRLDAVHSIWKALTSPLDDYLEDEEWPIQAEFKLLVKLENPVPKAELIRARLLKRTWPRSSRGKLLRTDQQIKTLAEVLAKENPKNRSAIFKALGLPLVSESGEHPANTPTEKHSDEPDASEIAFEKTFLEGEKRAAKVIVRNPNLRAAAKKRWGLKCYCCGFDFEQYYGSVANGLAIVHHIQLFTGTNGKPRAATVEDLCG